MRPHTIQNAEIPNPTLGTAERLRRFLLMIVSVPKSEADKQIAAKNSAPLPEQRKGIKQKRDAIKRRIS